jgi:hypothetical protein
MSLRSVSLLAVYAHTNSVVNSQKLFEVYKMLAISYLKVITDKNRILHHDAPSRWAFELPVSTVSADLPYL